MLRRSQWGPFLVTSLFVIAVIIWLAGCGDNSSPADNGETDTDPPAVAGVTTVDANHVQVLFSENVDPATSQSRNNYGIYRQMIQGSSPEQNRAPQAYGDTLFVESAALLLDGKTVLITMNPSSEAGIDYQLVVSSVQDLNGNAMTAPSTSIFTGTDAIDATPPTIIQRQPAPGATGFGVAQSVMVTFSEPMNWSSVRDAFSWSGPGGQVPFHMDNSDENVYFFTPTQPLEYGTQYTVGFAAATATDWSNNYLAAISWSFTTTSVTDNTPPVVESTVPADGATNVPLDAILQINFSEAIDPSSIEQGNILMTPEPGEGVTTWTNGGKTMNFDPDDPLLANTVYNLVALQGAVRDLAGNGLAEPYSLTFTTGSSFPSGQFSGTISGDQTSTQAADPEGVMVAASLVNLYQYMDEGPPPLGGSTSANHNGNYLIRYLGDGTYYPFAILDSNGDGEIDPDCGDAMGFYGVDFSTMPLPEDADSVVISGGNSVSGVDFAIYDPIAISGQVSYGGSLFAGTLQNYTCFIGLFDAATFDTLGTPQSPVLYDETNLAYESDFWFHEFDGLQEGTYYIAAYLDVNYNEDFDAGTDPFGYYSTGGAWRSVTVENGEDAVHVRIIIDDSAVYQAQPVSIVWNGSSTQWERNPRLERMLRLMSQAARQLKETR